MNLSKRLQAVATLVDINSRVIDVGCDHAFLDIYLTLNNGNNCLATDINKNALNVAKQNIEKFNLTLGTDGKLYDLLTEIKYPENFKNENIIAMTSNVDNNDNIVICGMGTYTILDILKTNKLSNTLIISSNNNIETLRREVINLGYYIDSEIFLFDKGKPYVVIKFLKGTKKYKEIDYKLGPILKNNIEYKKYVISRYNKILNNISKRKILLKLKYKLKILLIKKRFW